MEFLLFVVLILLIVLLSSNKKNQRLLKESMQEVRTDYQNLLKDIATIKERLSGSLSEPIPSQEKDTAHFEPPEEPEVPQIEEKVVQPPDDLLLKPEPAKVASVQKSEPSTPDSTQDTEKEPVQLSTPKEKSRFVTEVEQILTKLWNWIIVGEEHRRPNVSMEYAVASTWLLRLGIVALVVCVGYFLSWSIDRGILGPSGRVALSVIAGLAMLVSGIKLLPTKYRLLAEGFIGGGLACLYFATYAVGPLYTLVPIPASFGLMCLVTITAGILALRTGSQLVAILGIIGGFATPILLSSGDANLVVLYSYMLVLGLGVLGIAHAQQWRLLNYLAFVFTWGLFLGSLNKYEPAKHFIAAILFLSVLFVLHSAIVYYYNLLRKKRSTMLEIMHLLLNSILFAATSYNLIVEAHGRPWPAIMAIALSLFFIVHIYLFLKSQQHDRNLLIVFIGLAGFFTAWAVPLITEKETLTICWALLAFFILWVGKRLKSTLLIGISSLLYCIVMMRLVLWDMPRNFSNLNWAGEPLKEYWVSFASRAWTFGLVIGSLFGAFWINRKKESTTASLSVDEKNNLALPLSPNVLVHCSFWSGVLFLFCTLYFELTQMLSYVVPLQAPILTGLWVGLGLFVYSHYVKHRKPLYFGVSVILLAIALGKLLFYDFEIWGYMAGVWVYEQNPLAMLMRLIDFGVIGFFIIVLARMTVHPPLTISSQKVFSGIGTGLLFLYLSLETNTLFHWYLPLFQAGAITILWALFAISFLGLGIRKGSRSWRYTGLVLFTIVVGKVFLVDLADLETIYRVLAFMFVGILLITGAFAYIKADKKFIAKDNES